VAAKIAELAGVVPSVVEETTRQNSTTLFRLRTLE
jgi:hypothetical protein